jgi:putative redox protein
LNDAFSEETTAVIQTTNGDQAEKVTVITTEGGLRFAAHVRGHRIDTDQPERSGGDDSAAMPLELLAASLGTCIAFYAHQFCATRGIPSDGLRVEIRTETARGPYRVSRYDIKVSLPHALPDEYRAAIDRAVRTCPVHNTLTHSPDISMELVAAVAL